MASQGGLGAVMLGRTQNGPARAPDRWLRIDVGLVAMLTAAVYGQVVTFDFIRFDDPVYVTENRHVLPGITRDGLAWAATTIHGSNWHPLTWLSHMADVQLWGLWPGGHHLTSVLLHVGATLTLFAALARMTSAPRRSLVVAALFALHPTRVESVAWISERKDVLSAFLGFATLAAYAGYVETKTCGRYALVVALYALGLLAKPMLVTLPCILLLLDYWPLARLAPRAPADGARARRDVLTLVVEKLPLFALAAAASAVTVAAQRAGGSVVRLEAMPVGERVANALAAYPRYVATIAWPTDLAFFHPLVPVATARATAAAVALAMITAMCVWRARREPYLVVGWLWFVGALVPVIGLVQTGQQGVADRFVYVPAVGLFVAAVWGVADALAAARAPGRVAAGVAIATILVAASATVAQVGYWRDGETLFRRALAVTRDNFVAHMNLGHLASLRKDWVTAEAHYRAATRINPGLAEGYVDLATVMMAGGRDVEALAQLERAIALKPTLAEAHDALGCLAARAGDFAGARAHHERAITARPSYANAHADLGDLLVRAGDLPGGIEQYRQAVAAAPDSTDLSLGLGLALLTAGDVRGALAPFRAARAGAPANADVADALGVALLATGDVPGAIAALRAAVDARPGWPDAHHHLAAALGRAGHADASIAEIERTLALDRNLIEAYRSAGITLAGAGRPDDARRWLERGAARARDRRPACSRGARGRSRPTRTAEDPVTRSRAACVCWTPPRSVR